MLEVRFQAIVRSKKIKDVQAASGKNPWKNKATPWGQRGVFLYKDALCIQHPLTPYEAPKSNRH
jgi:hypothetical protein